MCLCVFYTYYTHYRYECLFRGHRDDPTKLPVSLADAMSINHNSCGVIKSSKGGGLTAVQVGV
jgi:hypothetical protein